MLKERYINKKNNRKKEVNQPGKQEADSKKMQRKWREKKKKIMSTEVKKKKIAVSKSVNGGKRWWGKWREKMGRNDGKRFAADGVGEWR